MKALTWVLKVVGVVLAVLFVVGLVLPHDFHVERSATVIAPAATVFDQVDTVARWQLWSPWASMDPAMETTYHGPAHGEGAAYSWVGPEAGEGRLTVTESQRPDHLKTDVEFGPRGVAHGTWTFIASGDRTEVTWAFDGRNGGPFGGWSTLFMEPMIGDRFEHGLASLKELAEREARKGKSAGDRLRGVARALEAAGHGAAGALNQAAERVDAAEQAMERAAKALEDTADDR